MAERVLRGSRLGASSFESETGVEFVARRIAGYDCPRGHHISVPLAADADVPATWECHCGETALAINGVLPEAKPTKPVRTHWDMLLERRSIDELEELLEERLAVLRSPGAKKSA